MFAEHYFPGSTQQAGYARPATRHEQFNRAQFAVALGDACAFLLGLYTGMIAADVSADQHLGYALVFGACLGTAVLAGSGAYRAGGFSSLRVQLMRLVPAFLAVLAYALVIIQLIAEPPPVAAWAAATFLGLAACRVLTHVTLVREASCAPSVWQIALVGPSSSVETMLSRLRMRNPLRKEAGETIVRQFELPASYDPEQLEETFAKIASAVQTGTADAVAIALPWDHEAALGQLIERLRALAVDAFLVGGVVDLGDRRLAQSWLAGIPALPVVLQPLGGWPALLKELCDRILALLALIAFAPLMLIAASAIKLDSPGPVLYRQRRRGLNGKPFNILKFRSMCLASCDNGTGVVRQATKGDPRITRVGSWLRRTSIDELPQLINVLKGEMSMVGPRPHAVAHDDYYKDLVAHYAYRWRMKPGITGLAQVNGCRGETETVDKMRKRIDLDLSYIDNWSLGLDFEILLRTLLVGFVHPEAR